ncbi:hypothetical protein C7N43_02920 [Sphingobacteriales bacterium UPWRP_1]|nr:hypothetical protein BVG80_09425 [Sphingobacteriales bacterium TSM_CSM]PSJ78572.1 hypothetical protein C7N43_02920 [Sphingobacteriales bacterium UPWRP_1]
MLNSLSKQPLLLFYLFIAVLLAACKGFPSMSSENKTARRIAFADSVLQVNIAQLLATTYTPDSLAKMFRPKNAAFLHQQFEQLYPKGTAKPLWLNPETGLPLPAVQQFLQQLQQAPQHALKPGQYQYQQLNNLYTSLFATDTPAVDTLLPNKAQFDALLSASALAYTSHLQTGYITPSRMWDVAAKQPPLAQNLLKAIQNNAIDTLIANATPAYDGYKQLQKQLAAYRSEAEKNPKGKVPNYNLTYEDAVKKIALNMERYRWLPHPDSVSSRRVWVNIPEFKMHVFDNNKEIDQITVVVGEPKNATPVLVNKPMSNVIFSPTWTIPTNIAQEEMEYILRNPAVLIVADVDVFVDGKKVDPRDVDWSTINKKRVKMRQRPKPTNSMGLVKFPFDNNFGIYIHDTPNKVDFGSAHRAQSHGCVRVAEPKKLAMELLQGSNWGEGGITKAMNSGKEQYARLPKPVSVTIYYLTAWTDAEGNLRFGTDVYGHDRQQLKQL